MIHHREHTRCKWELHKPIKSSEVWNIWGSKILEKGINNMTYDERRLCFVTPSIDLRIPFRHSLSLKPYHRITGEITNIYGFAFLDHVGMLLHHQPTNVREEESASWIIRVRVSVGVLVVHSEWIWKFIIYYYIWYDIIPLKYFTYDLVPIQLSAAVQPSFARRATKFSLVYLLWTIYAWNIDEHQLWFQSLSRGEEEDI